MGGLRECGRDRSLREDRYCLPVWQLVQRVIRVLWIVIFAAAPFARAPISTAACRHSLVTSSAGPITEPALTEISGIHAGVRNPEIWWVHNDSGDRAGLRTRQHGRGARHLHVRRHPRDRLGRHRRGRRYHSGFRRDVRGRYRRQRGQSSRGRALSRDEPAVARHRSTRRSPCCPRSRPFT